MPFLAPPKDGQAYDSAPLVAVPRESLISIEHPGIVRDVTRAIQSLGGDEAVAKFINSADANAPLNLYLNPEDPFRKPIRSTSKETSDVLLRVTVPKRTGRKRKRGSDEPFAFHPEDKAGAVSRPKELLRCLRDNADVCEVESLGMINREYRFRSLPDFRYSVDKMPFVEKVKDQLLTGDYDKIRKFEFGSETGTHPGMDMIPPPTFAMHSLPVPWGFEQVNRYTTETAPDKVAPKIKSFEMVVGETDAVPHSPHPGLPSGEAVTPALKDQISRIRAILDQRPIITRRALANKLDLEPKSLSAAIPYCAYRFDLGPWHDTLVKFGCDPREDAKYRIYQVLVFKLSLSGENKVLEGIVPAERTKVLRENHIFDGQKLPLQGRTFQVCDIIDEQVANIFKSDAPVAEVSWHGYGWYNAMVWCKAHSIMREKLLALLQGNIPDDSLFEGVIALPNNMTELDTTQWEYKKLRQPLSVYERALASRVRDHAKFGPHRAKRVNFEERLAIPSSNASSRRGSAASPNASSPQEGGVGQQALNDEEEGWYHEYDEEDGGLDIDMSPEAIG